jgi:hypothetical protein
MSKVDVAAKVVELFPPGYRTAKVRVEQLDVLCKETKTFPEDWTQTHGPGINRSIEVWYKHVDGRSAWFDDSNSVEFSIDYSGVVSDDETLVSDRSIELFDFLDSVVEVGNSAGMLTNFRVAMDELERIRTKEQEIIERPLSEGGLSGFSPEYWVEKLSLVGVHIERQGSDFASSLFEGCQSRYLGQVGVISAAVSRHFESDRFSNRQRD